MRTTVSEALSGSKTVIFGLTCVAPTEVTKGHPPYNIISERVASPL